MVISRLTLKKLLCTIPVLALCLSIGCSGESRLPTVEVSGKVLMNGKPVTGAAVRFYNPNLGGGAFNLDEQGHFSAPVPLKVGEYLVSLDRPGADLGDNPSQMSYPEDKSNQLPSKYKSATRSGLVAQLEVDKENRFIFELTGKLSTNGKKQKGPVAFQPLTDQD